MTFPLFRVVSHPLGDRSSNPWLSVEHISLPLSPTLSIHLKSLFQSPCCVKPSLTKKSTRSNADLTSCSSIRSFCTRFLTGKDQRVDAIIFAHEYQHIGPAALLSPTDPSAGGSKREAGSLATFLMITLLLPALLVAPVRGTFAS